MKNWFNQKWFLFVFILGCSIAQAEELRVTQGLSGSRNFYDGHGRLVYQSVPRLSGGETYYSSSGQTAFYP